MPQVWPKKKEKEKQNLKFDKAAWEVGLKKPRESVRDQLLS